MTRTTTFIAALAAALILPIGVAPALAGSEAPAETVDDILTPNTTAPPVEPPEPALIVFSADARIDGYRVDEELYLALGYDEDFPFFASLWLLVDEDADEWAPICVGFLLGDEDGALFAGESTIGDEDDGCMVVALGEDDDSNVAFGIVELEGDSVATAAMYAFG